MWRSRPCTDHVFVRFIVINWLLDHFDKKEAEEICDYYSNLGDLGYISIYETAKLIAEKYHYDENELIEAFLDGYISKEMIDFIKVMKEEYVVCLASNASRGLVEGVFKRNNIEDDLFDRLFMSCYYGVKKPDIKFYQVILSSLKQDFKEMYMVDDRDYCLEHVKELNITPILFTGLDDLKNFFKRNIN